jgi:hypothetical protein
MHVRRGFLGWGVFLIVVGAVPLLVRSGFLDSDQVDRLWTVWPLILVGIGVGLILRHTHFDFVGGLIVAATVGLMVGGLLSVGLGSISTGFCGSNHGSVAFPSRDGAFAASGSVHLELDCGQVTVGVAPGNAWHVAGSDDNGSGPAIDSTDASLTVRSRTGNGALFFGFGARDTWDVTVPDASTVDVDLQVNAGGATADLGGASLGTFDLEQNAGSATVDLGAVKTIGGLDARLNAGSLGLSLPNVSVTGTIVANAGAVRLCAPPGAALKLRTGENIVGSYDYDGHGLVKAGSTWTTPGFDASEVKIDLQTSANAGSFTLDPEDGCD